MRELLWRDEVLRQLHRLSAVFSSMSPKLHEVFLGHLEGCTIEGIVVAVDKWIGKTDWEMQKPRNPTPGELLAKVPMSARAMPDRDESEARCWWMPDGKHGGNWDRAPRALRE